MNRDQKRAAEQAPALEKETSGTTASVRRQLFPSIERDTIMISADHPAATTPSRIPSESTPPIVAALATAVMMSFAACAPSVVATGTPPPTPVPVRTEPIEWARRAPPVRAIGTLAGKEEIKLSFKVGGIVEHVFVDEGDTVTAGQKLASLKLPEVKAAVTQSRQGLQKAERDLERTKDLYAGKAATLEQLQNATTAVDLGRASLSAAAFNQEHATIRAPAAGKILRRLIAKDEWVAPGTPALVLRATATGWVLRAGVGDADVMRIELADLASVTFNALPGLALPATISEIAESASPTTGTFELEMRIDAAGTRLRSGLIGQATIRPAAKTTFGFIPIGALQEGDGERAYVFVPGSGDGAAKAVRREVTIDHFAGDQVAIRSGLDGSTAVITDGATRLAPGTPLQIEPSVLTAQVQP